ncbi:class I SAM-dependent methyltransferase [Arcobacter aquimarinus]|uniref:SAM-dependent methyltransferase n=1 Tax=Arcobacter aquimarinus TaxID=1315211 RepID=A0AAE7DZN9_9BACT|nr:class I SAM-dependent methyltransferase [Arcobacter aquimarinus]MCB9096405.1 methyltransferase domain-containing protein [Arcobacter sp.]QKE25133.1 SAM-dependent methyltransferase [Arcobacter aquimarinus]RXI36416.1 SAM-dependent methyltransferase [Arcobacter aquimarinus]
MRFEDIDFNKLYIEQKEASTFKQKSKEAWDIKADSMNKRVHKSIYNEQFLKLLNLEKIDTLLDIGCGVGNISLKLAPKLSKVYCLDYSTKMLELLNENAKKQNINNITTINKSWYDSWDDISNADLVIASRSMEVKNMKEALEKLNNKANKKVVISYKVGGSFVSDEILDVLQKDIIKKPDYIYVLNILYNMGINASLNFVQSEGRGTIYTSKEKFIESVSWSIGSLRSDEIKKLEDYYDNLDENKKFKEDFVSWAIISWDK